MVNLICHGMVFVSAFATLSARAKAVTSDRKPVSPEECRRCIISKALENSTTVDHSTPRRPEVQNSIKKFHPLSRPRIDRGDVNGHGGILTRRTLQHTMEL